MPVIPAMCTDEFPAVERQPAGREMKLLQQQQPAALLHEPSQPPVQRTVLILHLAADNQQSPGRKLLYRVRLCPDQCGHQRVNCLEVPVRTDVSCGQGDLHRLGPAAPGHQTVAYVQFMHQLAAMEQPGGQLGFPFAYWCAYSSPLSSRWSYSYSGPIASYRTFPGDRLRHPFQPDASALSRLMTEAEGLAVYPAPALHDLTFDRYFLS